MSLLLKSKLLRSEIKHWLLITALILWGVVATAYAFSKKEEILLIGLDDGGTRIITSQSDRLLKSELQKFILHFLDLYYSYDEKSFKTQVGMAADLFSEDFWNQEKSKLFALNEKLQKSPLTQSIQVESIDLVDDGKIEVLLSVFVKSRLSENKVKLQILIEYKKSERSEINPWGYSIHNISERTL